MDFDYNIHYNRLRKVSINLDVDPVVSGLQSLLAKLSEVQQLRNEVSGILAEAIRNKSDTEIKRRTAEYIRDNEMNKALVTNPDVTNRGSAPAREAAAKVAIASFLLDLHRAEVEYVRADAFCKYAEKIHDTLEAANVNLSRQISVVQMSIQIGEIEAPAGWTGPSKPLGFRPAT